MSAVIHFIGIVTFVTTSAVTPGPSHILIPRFHDIIPKDNNVISVPANLVDIGSTTWPMTNAGDSDNFEIDVKNISISGTGTFSADPANELPHLTCCCAAMKEGLSGDYDDKNPTVKLSAYVNLDHGFLKSYADPTTGEVHFDLNVDSDNGKLVITGSEKNKPDVQIVINLPSAGTTEIAFLNKPANGDHKGHWHSYYRMGKNPNSQKCTTAPSDGGDCSLRTTGCLDTQAAAPAKKAAAAKPPRLATPASALRLHKNPVLFTNVDCSNSQFP